MSCKVLSFLVNAPPSVHHVQEVMLLLNAQVFLIPAGFSFFKRVLLSKNEEDGRKEGKGGGLWCVLCDVVFQLFLFYKRCSFFFPNKVTSLSFHLPSEDFPQLQHCSYNSTEGRQLASSKYQWQRCLLYIVVQCCRVFF